MVDSRLFEALTEEVITCRLCPRLVAWREQASVERPRRYADDEYWARPLPGFGDTQARVLVVGLAPAAHGGNRTGRIFTGDRSGDWLFGSLYRVGFANQPTSAHPGDGLRVKDLYIAAVNRCCPPANRPTPRERDNCLPYLVREIELLTRARVVVALGSYAWDGALRALLASGQAIPRPRPHFGHGREAMIGSYTLIGSYHPSQQNTFTGVLTEEMFDGIFRRARVLTEG